MKKACCLFYLAAVAILMSIQSCSSDDNEDPMTVPEEDKLVLSSDKIEVNVFEVTTLWPEPQSSIFKLFDRFDSIQWGIPHLHEEKYIAKQESLTGNMNIGFRFPGIYYAMIKGYKNGKVVEGDTLPIRCYIEGDFLNIKWADNDKPGLYGIGGYNDVVHNYQLSLSRVKGEKPYAHLNYIVGAFPIAAKNTDAQKQHAESRQIFYDYITGLYGSPVYDYKGEDFVRTPYLSEYQKRFTVALDGLDLGITYTPVAIWDAPNSHIVLLGAVDNDRQESYPFYTVIAEPRKF